jgi:hypothetical protein
LGRRVAPRLGSIRRRRAGNGVVLVFRSILR